MNGFENCGSVPPSHATYNLDQSHVQEHPFSAFPEAQYPVGKADSRDLETLSIDSSKDGIDVLMAQPPATNFLQWLHQQSGWIVRNQQFRRGVLGVILVNTLVLGVRVALPSMVGICNSLVGAALFIFTFELILEVLHWQTEIFKRGWVLMDIVLISGSWFYMPLSILRGFRLLRALRKATGLRAVKDTVKAFLRALSPLLALVGLFIAVLYMFAVLFTDLHAQLHSKNDEHNNYAANQVFSSASPFANVRTSALTLLEIMTGGRLWSTIANEMTAPEVALLLGFVNVSIYLFGGMAIAQLVHAVTITSSNDKGLSSSSVISTSASFWDKNNGEPPYLGGAPPTTDRNIQRLEHQVQHLSRMVEQLTLAQSSLIMSLQEQKQAEAQQQLKAAAASPRPARRASVASWLMSSGVIQPEDSPEDKPLNGAAPSSTTSASQKKRLAAVLPLDKLGAPLND